MNAPPIIVTLMLDDAAHQHFDALRTAHFPPERLVVGAHITMFHAVPAICAAALMREVEIACAAMPPFRITVTGTRFLGRGVAFGLAAPAAEGLRSRLAHVVAGGLTPQDRARWSPHITIQNKVAPAVARRTEALLGGISHPSRIVATGVALWTYEEGPWRGLREFTFDGKAGRDVPSPPDPASILVHGS